MKIKFVLLENDMGIKYLWDTNIAIYYLQSQGFQEHRRIKDCKPVF
jgi:hypothetical protein